MKVVLLVGLLSGGLWGAGVAHAQTNTVLWPGEIVLTGYTTTGGAADWGFIPLVDLSAGTELRLTNNGWQAAGGFRPGETTSVYTVPAGGVRKGDVISYSAFQADFSQPIPLAAAGDQLLLYQGTDAAPTFVAALTYGPTGFSEATSAATTALPPGLSVGTSAVALPDGPDASCAAAVRAGLPAELRAAFNLATNWTTSLTPNTWSNAALSVSEGLVPDAQELAALQDFYNSTNGPSTWYNRTGWLQGTNNAEHWATWYGVGTSGGDVIKLDLYNKGLSGSLPPAISKLTQLQYLSLGRSIFSSPPAPNFTVPGLGGTLPQELGQLTHLRYLAITNALVSGSIPPELGQLAELTYLDLNNNHLTGSIPPELGQLGQLQYLNLDNYNRLVFEGNRNALTGGIPKELGQLTNLTSLALDMNPLGGPLPPELGQLTKLTFLEVDDAHLSGAVPAEILRLPLLQTLILGSRNRDYSDPNTFTSLPDPSVIANKSGLTIALQYNQFEFGTLEPYFSAPGQLITAAGSYLPQTLPQDEQTIALTTGQALSLASDIGGTRTRYQWQRENGGSWQPIPGATGPSYQVAATAAADAGRYRCQATNDFVTGLTLTSRPYLVRLTGGALPPSDPADDLDRNWSFSRTFDLDGTITGESKQFADAMGRPTQSQSKNLAEGHVFATQSLNSTGGVAVLSTLPAPINNQEFKYKTGFVTATTVPAGGGAPTSREYAPSNFERPTNGSSPDPLDEATPGTLGYYYSPNNTWESATAATHNPFSLSEPTPGPLGGMRRAAGPGDEFRLGSGREARGRDFPLLNELDHYAKMRALFVPGSATPSLRARGVKVVGVSPNGVESVTLSNREGQAVAACLTGDQYPASTLTGAVDSDPTNAAGDPIYQDIHIAASATPATLTVIDQSSAGVPSTFVVIDLLSNPLVETAYSDGQTIRLVPGFYRIQSTSGRLSYDYQVHYGNFSYAFYDDAGRAVASIAPKGVDELLATGLDNAVVAVPNFVTTKVFDTSGRVLSVTTPDEGTTRYVYARDGRIRFSQSAIQAQPTDGTPPRFSYSNYDQLGRVIESGEYAQAAAPGQGLVFEEMRTAAPAANSVLQAALLEERVSSAGPAGSLDVAQCAQRSQVWYDSPQADPELGNRKQDFVLGAVAKTSKGATSTWYSYNDLGQLTWLVQKAPVVGVKAVDYTYDAAGNVTRVAYQSGQPDAFNHYYSYDANQRLTVVTTSPTDAVAADRTVQARYFYYLHGPLKRVETAGTLQGTDYAYTVQGWLKSINGANRHLDGDSPANNGMGKDLFGLTLDYFSGDYRSARPGLATPNLPAGAPATRYDGLVRSAAWFTAANPAMRQHLFTYDEKGQLKQADFGTLQPGATLLAAGTFVPAAANAYEEGGLKYDFNGNIETLRRRDGVGQMTDNFAYQYPTGSNKLTAVNNPAGTAVLDYDYDATGQMTRQRDEKGQRYLTYDVTGKVTGVYRDVAHSQPLAVFAYDDRGFRASKASYDPTTFQLKKTTYSVRDAAGNELSSYVVDAAQPAAGVQRAEVPLYGASRLGALVRLPDGTDDYRYELNDQLGNARLIYHKPGTTTYTATLEPGAASQEEKDFANLPATRFTAPGHGGSATVARLGITNGQSVGPAKTLTVQRGDTVTFTAYAWLTAALINRQAGGIANAVRVVPLVSLTAPTRANAARLTEGGTSAGAPAAPLPQVQVGVGLLPTGRGAATANALTAIPGNAQLHYIVRDEQGTVVLDDYQSADPRQPLAWQQLQVGLRLQQAGTVELRVETVDALNPDVFVDDVRVDYTQSTIVQEQHNYAYGAPMLGLNYVVGATRYRHGYQGQYAEVNAETGTDDFELRNYDSRIGRWTAPDPAGQYSSPYVGMGNNPVLNVDPDGGLAVGATFFQKVLAAIGIGSINSNMGGLATYTAATFAQVGSFGLNASLGAASTAVRAGQGPGQGPGKPAPRKAFNNNPFFAPPSTIPATPPTIPNPFWEAVGGVAMRFGPILPLLALSGDTRQNQESDSNVSMWRNMGDNEYDSYVRKGYNFGTQYGGFMAKEFWSTPPPSNWMNSKFAGPYTVEILVPKSIIGPHRIVQAHLFFDGVGGAAHLGYVVTDRNLNAFNVAKAHVNTVHRKK